MSAYLGSFQCPVCKGQVDILSGDQPAEVVLDYRDCEHGVSISTQVRRAPFTAMLEDHFYHLRIRASMSGKPLVGQEKAIQSMIDTVERVEFGRYSDEELGDHIGFGQPVSIAAYAHVAYDLMTAIYSEI
jgi:hypothetical protein